MQIVKETIIKKSMFKRISKELIELYNEYNDIHIQYNNETKIHTISILNDNYKYTFHLNNGYPFNPPVNIFVNNIIPYKSMLKITAPRFIKYIHQLMTKSCLCCWSISLKRNWGPTESVFKIMNEIKRVQKVKKKIIILVLLDKIKIKYNIPDDIRIQ